MIMSNIIDFNKEYENIRENLLDTCLSDMEQKMSQKNVSSILKNVSICIAIFLVSLWLLWLFNITLLISCSILVIMSVIMVAVIVINTYCTTNNEYLQLAKRYSNYTVEKEAKKALYAIQSYNKITYYEFLALKQTILVDKLSKLYNKELDYLNVKDGKLNINDIEFDDFVLANSKYITKVDNLEVTNNVQDIYMNYTSSILEVYLGVKNGIRV